MVSGGRGCTDTPLDQKDVAPPTTTREGKPTPRSLPRSGAVTRGDPTRMHLARPTRP